MISIKTLTKQEYEKNHKSPSELIFYKSEKNLCEIISEYLSKNIKENIEILEKFLLLPSAEVYEIERIEGIFYIVEYKTA